MLWWSKSPMAVAKKLLPSDASLVDPRSPQGCSSVQSADMDGDGENEIAATYEWRGEIKAMFLKKSGAKWKKLTDVDGKGYDLDYAGFIDITGNGKKVFLLGCKSGTVWNELGVYTIENGAVRKLDNRTYSIMDIDNGEGTGESSKVNLALWNDISGGLYKIEIISWNGNRFAPAGEIASYYGKKVVPFYQQKVTKNPGAPEYLYYLADAQVKSGQQKEALQSIEQALELSPGEPLNKQLTELKEMVDAKV